jgi:hypothetical protein
MIIFIRKRGDPRRRKNRIQEHINAWRRQLPWLVDAYLAWRNESSGRPTLDPSDSNVEDSAAMDSSWAITVLDFYGVWDS